MRSVRTTQPHTPVSLIGTYKQHLIWYSLPGIPGGMGLGKNIVHTYPAAQSNLIFTSNTIGAGNSGKAAITSSAGVKHLQFERVGGGNNAWVELSSGSDWTFICVVDDVSYDGTNPGFWRSGATNSGNTFCIFVSTTGSWIRLNGTDYQGSQGRPSAGSKIMAVFSVRSGQWVCSAINGVIDINTSAAATTPDMTGTNGIVSWGEQNADSEHVYGKYALLAMFNHFTPPDLAREISENPWQIFDPERRRAYFIPAGAVAYTMAADGGAYALTGIASGLLAKRMAQAGIGAYALGGVAATPRGGRKALAAEGQIVLSGIAATTRAGRNAQAGLGVYALTGINSALPLRRVTLASVGSITITAIAAAPLLKRRISAAEATVTITGIDISTYCGFFIRPDSTVNAGTWTTELGGSNLSDSIDEVAINDADYIQSATGPSADTADIGYANPAYGVAEPVIVRYRYKKDSSNQQINLTVQLMEGASVRATWTHTNISTSFATAEQVLSAAEFASVTNWNAVSTQFIATAV